MSNEEPLMQFDELEERQPSVILFEDKWSKLETKQITLKTYYFPTGKAKVIKLHRIRGIYYTKQGILNGQSFQSEAWGKTVSPVWWACDTLRNIHMGDKHYNIILDCGEQSFKGFTIVELEEFLSKIRPLLSSSVMIEDKFPF